MYSNGVLLLIFSNALWNPGTLDADFGQRAMTLLRVRPYVVACGVESSARMLCGERPKLSKFHK